jgi:hypothetical protein
MAWVLKYDFVAKLVNAAEYLVVAVGEWEIWRYTIVSCAPAANDKGLIGRHGRQQSRGLYRKTRWLESLVLLHWFLILNVALRT